VIGATATAASSAALPGLGQTALSLVVVLAAIFALAAGLRKLQGIRGSSGRSMRVSETLQLGPKERLLLIEAAGQHLLVGIGGNGQMQTLHVYVGVPPTLASAGAETVTTPAAAPIRPTLAIAFAEVLKRSLGRGAAG
jgi:flagellar protein FliO/FliZ